MKILIIIVLSCLLGLSSQQSSPGTCPSHGICSALWETNGDVTIGIVANIHIGSVDQSNYKHCSVFQAQDVELIEVVRWLLKRIDQAGYIPGIQLGVKVFDACERSDIVSASAVSMLPYLRYANISVQKSVDGILGILTSSQAQHLVDTLADTNVPLVSPTATAPSLSENSHFFRTIPSDELQMKVLYNLIKSLQMKYIAVVYSDDQFGHQGKTEIEHLADEDGGQVCIAASIVIKSFHDAIRIVDTLADLQQNLNQRNLPVLFIGQYTNARGLVIAANTNQAAHRLLWVFPDSIGVKTSVFNEYPKIGRNSLSVSPYYNIIQEFRSYWTQLLYNATISGTSTYPPYYREYLENILGCSVASGSCTSKTVEDINTAYSQPSYINTVIHSVFAFAKTIKTLHEEKCGTQNGPCPEFENTLKSTSDPQFMDILRSISANYTGLDNLPFMPLSIQNSSGFYFEPNGNLGVREMQNIYLIHNAKCQPDCVFEIVGAATSNVIQLDFDKITLYLNEMSNEVTLGSQLPSIYCINNCQPCEDKFNPDIRHASIWGEYFIIGFVPIHRPGSGTFSCGNIRDRQSIEDAEAMLYGIDSFNNKSGPWRDKPVLAGHLGIIVFDSCQNSLLAASILSQWLSGTIKVYDRQGRYFNPKKCLGIIGGLYSQINLQLLDISRKEFLVQIGYASSSLELPLNSPEFLRTIPADDIQAQAMIDLVKKLGFSAFSVIYLDDSYGFNGYRQLALKADEAKLCINKVIAIPQNVHEEQLSDVFAALQDAEETKVVIVFSGADEGKVILKTANKKTIRKKFVWIGSEAWGARNNLIVADTGNEALGLTVIDFPLVKIENYTKHITGLKPNQNSRNMFFREWWQNQFQCRLSSAAIPNPLNKCDDELTIQPPTDVQTAMFALKAVWTMALGLSKAYTRICNGDSLNCATKVRNENSRKIIADEIRATKLLQNGQEYNVYSSRGDGAVTVDLWNVQRVQKQKKFVKVAEYTEAGLKFLNSTCVKHYDTYGKEADKPKSTCFQCNCIYRYPDDPLIMLNNNIVINGQVYIVAYLPFHKSRSTSEIDKNTGVLAEALRQVLERVNADIFGKQILGLLVFDSYGDKDIAALQTTLVMDAGIYLKLKKYNTNSEDLVCVLTYGTGIDSKYVNKALTREIAHMNIGKTIHGTGTSSKYFYNLGYTLEEELSVLAAVVKHYDWTDLTLVYSNSEESIYARDTFIKSANHHGLCAIESYVLEAFISAIQNNKIISSIVVLVIDGHEVRHLLNTAGTRLRIKKFIAWSKLTDSMPFIGGNSYKAFLNNTIGVSIDVGLINPDIISGIPNEKSIAIESNPWLDGNVMDYSKAKDDVKFNIKQMRQAIHSFANALQSLMLAECGGIEDICDDLLQKPGWNTQRLSLFLDRDIGFSKAVHSKNKFIIQCFQMKSYFDDQFIVKEVGTYDPGTQSITITDSEQSSFYETINSQCKEKNCKDCKTGTTSGSFPGWGIAFIVIIILLVISVITLLVYILLVLQPCSEKEKPPLSNGEMELIYSEVGLQMNGVGHSQRNGTLQYRNHLQDNTDQQDGDLRESDMSHIQTSGSASNPDTEPAKDARNPYRMYLDLRNLSLNPKEPAPCIYTAGDVHNHRDADLHGNVKSQENPPLQNSSVTKPDSLSDIKEDTNDTYSLSFSNKDIDQSRVLANKSSSRQAFNGNNENLEDSKEDANKYSMSLSSNDIVIPNKSKGQPWVVLENDYDVIDDSSGHSDKNLCSIFPPVKNNKCSQWLNDKPVFGPKNEDSISNVSVDV